MTPSKNRAATYIRIAIDAQDLFLQSREAGVEGNPSPSAEGQDDERLVSHQLEMQDETVLAASSSAFRNEPTCACTPSSWLTCATHSGEQQVRLQEILH